jgi:hypothetical protein
MITMNIYVMNNHSLQDQGCIVREINRLTTGRERASYDEEDEERAEVTFHLSVFVENFIIHMFNLVPLILYLEGWQGVKNRSFFRISFMCFIQWFTFFSFYASIVLFAPPTSPLLRWPSWSSPSSFVSVSWPPSMLT